MHPFLCMETHPGFSHQNPSKLSTNVHPPTVSRTQSKGGKMLQTKQGCTLLAWEPPWCDGIRHLSLGVAH